MNLTDLTAELQSRAGQAGSTAATERLAGIRARVRARRRRQAVTGAAVAVAVAVLAPIPWTGDGGRPVPPGPPAPSRDEPLTFDPDDAGDPLVAARVSEHATRELELRFTPRDTDISVSTFCRLAAPPTGASPRGVVTVNGRDLGENDCRVDAWAGSGSFWNGEDAATNRAGWARLDVRPGRESVLRVRMAGTGGSAILGIGVYERSGARIELGGVVVRRRVQVGDHDYALVGHRTARITATTRELELTTPSGDRPGWLVAGTTGGGDGAPGVAVPVLVNGEVVRTNIGGGVTEVPVGGPSPRVVGVQAPPGVTGTMLLAYYELVGPAR
jgi:hypothetical protein